MSSDDDNQGDRRARAAVTSLAMAAAFAAPVACAGKQAAPTERAQPAQPKQPDDVIPESETGDETGADEDVAPDGPGDWSNQGGTRG